MQQEITQEFVFSRLPVRAAESNKGSYGKLLCVAGSLPFRGAAALCAEGALRTGAGIVTLAAIEPVLGAVLPRLPECVLLPCRTGPEGGIDAEEAPRLQAYAQGCRAAVLGCGMGNSPATAALARALAALPGLALVLDADGLNALAAHFPAKHAAALVVTPHPGEMARLCGRTVAQVEADRAGTALAFARQHRCVTVLKGHRTLVAGPEGQLFCNTTGGPGLARGGSGDVLAGMLGALLAQGLEPLDAACCAVWLHGAAGDLCARRLGQYGMLPHDLFAELGALFAQNGR